MSLSHEHVGPKILGKIKIYVLTRAELLFPLCYEIPCNTLCLTATYNYIGLFIFAYGKMMDCQKQVLKNSCKLDEVSCLNRTVCRTQVAWRTPKRE